MSINAHTAHDSGDGTSATQTAEDIAAEDDARPRHKMTAAASALTTATPASADPVFEQMLRGAVQDREVLGRLLAEYRTICRLRARDRNAGARALKDLARITRNAAIYQMYRRGERLTDIGPALGIQIDLAHRILCEQQRLHGDPVNTRRDGARAPFSDEIAAIQRSYSEEDEAEDEAAAKQIEREAGAVMEIPPMTIEEIHALAAMLRDDDADNANRGNRDDY